MSWSCLSLLRRKDQQQQLYLLGLTLILKRQTELTNVSGFGVTGRRIASTRTRTHRDSPPTTTTTITTTTTTIFTTTKVTNHKTHPNHRTSTYDPSTTMIQRVPINYFSCPTHTTTTITVEWFACR